MVLYMHCIHPLPQLLCEAEEGGHSELQAMRERHKHKFLEATAALRSQHKTLAKRVKLLETQLLKNSVKYADSCL